MTDDVETELRAALQYNADRVDLREPQLRTKSTRRLGNRVWAALAAAACVVTIVGATVLGRGLHHGATAAPPYEGRHWILASVVHAGRTTAVPAKLGASIDFNQSHDFCAGDVPSGTRCLSISDSVNSVGASYRRTEQGFVATTVVASGAGSTSQSVVRDGMDRVGNAAVTASVDAHQLTLSTSGYTLIFTDGHPPTSTSGSFVGRRWLLTSVHHAGRTVSVPSTWLATVDFEDPPKGCSPAPVGGKFCPGVIAINDTINYISGTYRLTAAGFATSDIGTTYVGYDGRHSVRGEVIDALAAVAWGRLDGAGSDGNPNVGATITAGGTLTLTALGYTLGLVAHGTAPVDTSSPSPTSTR